MLRRQDADPSGDRLTQLRVVAGQGRRAGAGDLSVDIGEQRLDRRQIGAGCALAQPRGLRQLHPLIGELAGQPRASERRRIE
ncbi:hypothetical protein [Micromonospora tarensis]|uniref:Uncharacterized protein n=1 Tax=Micromonospora tarensis TaxID=2806100 RepID=A0ABS1Y9F0_9ACTN|nr:hypothetical protein [Micromonospora tarensis]MBM0274023.1 hypothetical protein [Micromonospora tarensis]